MIGPFTQAHYILLACVLLLHSLAFHPTRAEAISTRCKGGGGGGQSAIGREGGGRVRGVAVHSGEVEVEANAEDFVVGVVCDTFLRYAPYDSQVCEGARWWVDWVNRNGGVRYPKKNNNNK